jgi:serine phosphatase RsbU (regulator of sigma subunit)
MKEYKDAITATILSILLVVTTIALRNTEFFIGPFYFTLGLGAIWLGYCIHKIVITYYTNVEKINRAKKLQELLYSWDIVRFDGLELYGEVKPCSDFSGDFFYYNLTSKSPEGLRLFVGDVQGHDLPSAFWMSLIVGALHQYSEMFDAPDEINYVINSSLHAMDMDIEIGFALLTMYIDTDEQELTYSISGMPNIWRLRNGEAQEIAYGDKRLALGLVNKFEIENKTVDIEPGDRYIICSDGILEAENDEGEQFQDKLPQIIQDCKDLNTVDSVQHIHSSVDKFSVDHIDDRTVVIINNATESP